MVLLSADFRLSRPDGKSFTDNYDTQKILPIARAGWSALIAYCGLASAPPLLPDMGQWILRRINEVPLLAGLEDLERRLLTLNDLLRRIGGTHEKKLWISVVGFQGRRPFESLITNAATPAALQPGLLYPRTNRPKISVAKLRGEGGEHATLDEKQRLRRVLEHSSKPDSIREELYELNAKISQRSKTVSRACVTGYLLPDGHYQIGPHGIPEDVPYLPGFVASELRKSGIRGFDHKLDKSGKVLPIRWVASTSAPYDDRGNVGTASLHVIRNVGAARVGDIEVGRTVFGKIAGPNEPKQYKIESHGPSAELAPSVAVYHNRLVDYYAPEIAKTLTGALAKGALLDGVVVMLLEMSDSTAGALARESTDGFASEGRMVALAVEASVIAQRLESFAPGIGKVVEGGPPKGAVRLVCIAAGSASAGFGYYAPRRKTFRRGDGWLFHAVSRAAG